ncbi:hypothetical protein ES288_D08G256800v1 [Gossypium darwinii]|uniref:Uncharacterized protein n=1 Tax=Gossypium darwinii TaxID=34276 RepID=A0A5D2BRR4_GOSDA|nr:hypothetical protein ES288_D08G256800v1 [Gossypium darwinii]
MSHHHHCKETMNNSVTSKLVWISLSPTHIHINPITILDGEWTKTLRTLTFCQREPAILPNLSSFTRDSGSPPQFRVNRLHHNLLLLLIGFTCQQFGGVNMDNNGQSRF